MTESAPASGPGDLPAGVRRRVARVLADIAAEDGGAPRVRWLAGAVDTDPAGEAPADVVVAHDVVPHAEDPEAAVRQLLRQSRRHLVVTAPREPLAHLGIQLAGPLLAGRRPHAFTGPDLLRVASTAGAVRATHLPLLWTVLWVRRT